MMNKLRISISSPPDRENLVAEIFFETEQVAEINQESGSLMIEIYPKRSGECWLFDLDDLTEVLNVAKHKLKGPSRA
jgi:hypothetical protein